MFAGKKSAQIREILISESAWEEMTCLFAPSLKIDEGQVKLIEERHYKLVPVKELDSSDISNYRMSV